MPVVSADTTRMAMVEANAAGALPPTPAFDMLSISGESLNFEPSTSESGLLDPSRGVRDQIITGGAVTGDINTEVFKSDSFDLLLAAAMGNDWGVGHASLTADDLIIGPSVRQFYVERRFQLDNAPTYTHHMFTKCVVSQMALNLQTGQPITASFSLSGSDVTIDANEPTGATYADPGVLPVFRPSEIVTLDVGGFTGTECGQSFNLNLNGNVSPVNCLGSRGAREQILGRAQMSFEGAFYFSSNIDDLYQAFLDAAEFPVTLKIEDTAANKNAYTFAARRAKIASMTVNATGSNEAVVASINITTLVPATEPKTPVMITRETA